MPRARALTAARSLRHTKLSSFANQGEICLCGSRIYVQRGIYDEFVRRFVELTKALRVGDPRSSESFMGALASAACEAMRPPYGG